MHGALENRLLQASLHLAMLLGLVEVVRGEGSLIRVDLVESTLVLAGVELLGADCLGWASDASTKGTSCSGVLLLVLDGVMS